MTVVVQLLLCLWCVVVVAVAAESSSPVAGERQRQQQLWVFGDSYADTGNLGNLGRELTHAWYDPYGRTFPRHPTGRFSDGRVLTDFVECPYTPLAN
uniref:GDSL esterase/lipase n=1 Tax=Oryza brachyantha TaxID=4533 RepID=J3N097_ORYBR